jgi:hypothetical protein
MSGAEIQNAVVTAAYLAAEEDRIVGMRHLVRGVLAEHRKMGRYLPDAEFGPYAALVRDAAAEVPRSAPDGAATSAASGADGDGAVPAAPAQGPPTARRAPHRVVSP